MGDRGNIAVIQSEDRSEQVWFYGHWSGWRMPAVVQHGLRDGKGRWDDWPYLARIIFCRLVSKSSLLETTSFGISTSIGDNEYPIMVVDCPNQRVFEIDKSRLKDGKIPQDYKAAQEWTFEEYSALEKLPRGASLEEHLKEIGLTTQTHKEAA